MVGAVEKVIAAVTDMPILREDTGYSGKLPHSMMLPKVFSTAPVVEKTVLGTRINVGLGFGHRTRVAKYSNY